MASGRVLGFHRHDKYPTSVSAGECYLCDMGRLALGTALGQAQAVTVAVNIGQPIGETLGGWRATGQGNSSVECVWTFCARLSVF